MDVEGKASWKRGGQKKESDIHIESKRKGPATEYSIISQLRVVFKRCRRKKACGLPIDLERIRTSVGLPLARPAENCVGEGKGKKDRGEREYASRRENDSREIAEKI